MHFTSVPYDSAIAFPVLQWRDLGTFTTFDLGIKIFALELVLLRRRLLIACRALCNKHLPLVQARTMNGNLNMGHDSAR